MKRQIKFLICNFIAFLIIIQVREVYGNAYATWGIPEIPSLRIFILTIMFIIGTYIEYKLLKLGTEELELRKKDFLKPVFKVNLVTYPLTQILAYVVYLYILPFFWLFALPIELIVILIEWQLLKIELHRRTDQIPSKKILSNMFKVNLVSFLVGLIAFFPISLMN